MTTVFLSGSRRISRLSAAVRTRLKNMIEKELRIVVGDANGADKAMQAYLSEEGYRNVKVYCAGPVCRNNVGSWSTHNINVDSNLKGRAFYTEKDKEMAKDADIGFILWDGQSSGSIANALELLGAGKAVVLFFAPEKEFHNIKSTHQLANLVRGHDAAAYEKLFNDKRNAAARAKPQPEQSTLPIF